MIRTCVRTRGSRGCKIRGYTQSLFPGGPVMGLTDLQRYTKLLLEKGRELSSAKSDARALVPATGGLQGDMIDQANADAAAELQIRLHRTDGRQARAIEHASTRSRQAN